MTWKLTRIVLVSRVTGDGAMRWRLICRRIGGASRSTSIGPVPVGQPAVPEPCVTTAVCADVAVLEPVVFVAVTATRIVFPLSVLVSVYVLCVADAIAAHAAPFVSQRCHAYAYVIPVPVHVPGRRSQGLPDDRRSRRSWAGRCSAGLPGR